MITTSIYTLSLLLLTSPLQHGDTSAATTILLHQREKAADRGFLSNFYTKYISPIDGDRCPMIPTCSEYSRQAFHKCGFIYGFVLTADRLTRCGADRQRYKEVRDEDGVHLADPLEDNLPNRFRHLSNDQETLKKLASTSIPPKVTE